jgi:hypothetical protein
MCSGILQQKRGVYGKKVGEKKMYACVGRFFLGRTDLTCGVKGIRALF